MYRYKGCKDPPQRITGDSYELFNFGRSLPPTKNEERFRVKWTAEKDKELISLAPNKSWKELADHFITTSSSVLVHYRLLVRRGLAPPLSKQREWTEEQIEYLRTHVNDPYKSLVAALDKHETTIWAKIKELGLTHTKKLPTNSWKPEEEEYLKKNLANKGIEYCAEHLGRSLAAIRGKAYTLGFLTLKGMKNHTSRKKTSPWHGDFDFVTGKKQPEFSNLLDILWTWVQNEREQNEDASLIIALKKGAVISGKRIA